MNVPEPKTSISENELATPAQPGPEPGLRWQAAGRALRHRNFQLFFGGQLISLTGTWMQTVAQSWLVYKLTGSGLLLGAVGFSSQIPVFLFAPIGGITADRVNRQRVVIATQTVSMLLAFVLAALTLTHAIDHRIWLIFVLAALLGVVNAFDIPGRQSFLVDMVGKEDLMNAIALNSSMFNGARVIGPAVAGVLVARLGEGWCFFANAVSYIAVIVGLLLMRVNTAPRVSRGSPLANIVEGFRFVEHTAPIRTLLLLLGVVSVTGMPYVVLMPIFADRLRGGGQEFASLIGAHDLGAVRLGILMGAAGVGALLGALTLAMRSGVKGLGRWVVVCCAGFGVSLMLFAASKLFWLSVALLMPVGYFIMLQMAASNTLIQAMVPDALRGRVMAVYSMMFMGMAPIGALLGGAISDRLGAPATVAIGGMAAVAGAWWFGVQLPKIRVEARRLIVAQSMAGGEPAEEMTAKVVED
jgi:MFS family permease